MRILPLLLLPVLVSATPFRPADLPAGSAWFLHVDHDAVRSAPLGASLMSQSIDDASCPLPPKAKAFLTETGFDYRRDLRAITVFGSGAERQASILVRHSADDLKVGEFLRKQGAKTTTVEGAPCLAYDCGPDGNECTLFIAFPQPGVIAIGMSAKDLGLALRSLESERAESALPALAAQEGITNPSILAAVDMVACAEANPRLPAMARQFRVFGMAAGEVGDKVVFRSRTDMVQAPMADNVVKMVEGFAAMAASRDANAASWLEGLAVKASGAQVTTDYQVSAQRVLEEIARAKVRMAEWRAKRAAGK